MPNDRQGAPCVRSPHDLAGLRALPVSTSPKRAAGEGDTDPLMGVPPATMERGGVTVDRPHRPGHRVPPGVHPDMTEHGWERDDRPALRECWLRADIPVVGAPSRLGEEVSVRRGPIERLHGMSGRLDDRGQSVFHGRAGGRVVAGDEDGTEHAAVTLTCARSRQGHAIPPLADRGAIGGAGPGIVHDDARGGRIGVGDDLTRRDAPIMTWSSVHKALALRGGIPSHGEDRRVRAAGRGAGQEKPEHRA